MLRGPIAVVAGVVLALSLTACAGGAVPESSTPRPPSRILTPAPSTAPQGTAAEPPAARWETIVADLAARGVTGTPTVALSETVTWPDGSLGCAAPGQSYTQALVDGMRIVVEVDGRTYDYRFGVGDEPKLCEQPQPQSLRDGGATARAAAPPYPGQPGITSL